ncbi:BZ3500_MvSof-1268-A1-R1_Chr5-1g07575 [Microbotryum saponariae]|uniref:BZ3500_MvSof-1268-A1-R1_Chr5-1g07575 protein n=1 Tax=Microbotryum saponariae TaxID=289078 RepID=A0A2X0MBW7_9BASI|nr:BZ3500_MvSof-1268-A1-R1_Chr5-1g07575 [Microbotryum saponariae]SDA05446.1 BZ3501_MvSof-1269-A2-R1_Chr5-2g07399 [Microbotryum saponariae]
MSTPTTAPTTAKASTSKSSPTLTEQGTCRPDLVATKSPLEQANALFRNKTGELQALASKIGELEREAEEHGLVIETLTEANATTPDRKCFRLVGGILVERTVADVLPALQTQLEQLKGVLGTLLGEYKKKETSFSDWQRDNNSEPQLTTHHLYNGDL